jgi:hypothetical protein
MILDIEQIIKSGLRVIGSSLNFEAASHKKITKKSTHIVKTGQKGQRFFPELKNHDQIFIMNASPDNLNQLSNYLRLTTSPDASVRKPAEEFLRNLESQRGFPLLLLTLLDSPNDNNPDTGMIKISAAINFKNFIKRNWKVVSVSDYFPKKIT